MSKRNEELVVKSSISECTWKSSDSDLIVSSVDNTWYVGNKDGIDDGVESADFVLPCVCLDKDMSIKLNHQQRSIWKKIHFHDKLCIDNNNINKEAVAVGGGDSVAEGDAATTTTNDKGFVLLFEAKAHENISIALSTEPEFNNENDFYEVIFGCNGNTSTIIKKRRRRRSNNNNKKLKRGRKRGIDSSPSSLSENVITRTFPCRVCSDASYIKYWIVYTEDSKLYVGVGNTPGFDCIGVLIDDNDDDKDSPPKKEADEETPEQETEEEQREDQEDQKAEKEEETKEEEQERGENEKLDEDDEDKKPAAKVATNNVIKYVGFGNLTVRGGGKGNKPNNNVRHYPISVQKVCLTTDGIPDSLISKLATLPDELPLVYVDNNGVDTDMTGDGAKTTGGGNKDDEMKRYMEEYYKECKIRKTRAEKYGTKYVPPKFESFLPWTTAKRLKDNPIVGSGSTGSIVTGIDLLDSTEINKQQERLKRFAKTNNEKEEHDGKDNPNNNDDDPDTNDDDKDNNDESIRETTTIANEESISKSKSSSLPVIQGWDKEKLLRQYRIDPPKSMWKNPPSTTDDDAAVETSATKMNEFRMEPPKPATVVPDKIHLFAIDWAAFKQIRNKDLMVSPT